MEMTNFHGQKIEGSKIVNCQCGSISELLVRFESGAGRLRAIESFIL